ncbi:hypothetical protein BBP40_002598 [Aspergillus hancockii]|nr:hypothetical protein BBP40_002598 [Aspergillus hancockii]
MSDPKPEQSTLPADSLDKALLEKAEPHVTAMGEENKDSNLRNWSPLKKRLMFISLMSSSILADGLPAWLWPQFIAPFMVLGATLSNDYGTFNASQSLQGLFGTVPLVVGLPIIHDMYRPEGTQCNPVQKLSAKFSLAIHAGNQEPQFASWPDPKLLGTVIGRLYLQVPPSSNWHLNYGKLLLANWHHFYCFNICRTTSLPVQYGSVLLVCDGRPSLVARAVVLSVISSTDGSKDPNGPTGAQNTGLGLQLAGEWSWLYDCQHSVSPSQHISLRSTPTSQLWLSAIINAWRTAGGFSIGYFQPSWIAKISTSAVIGTQVAIVVAVLILTITPVIIIEGRKANTHVAQA